MRGHARPRRRYTPARVPPGRGASPSRIIPPGGAEAAASATSAPPVTWGHQGKTGALNRLRGGRISGGPPELGGFLGIAARAVRRSLGPRTV